MHLDIDRQTEGQMANERIDVWQMDGPTYGGTDRCTNGQTDGRMGGRTDGLTIQPTNDNALIGMR